MLNLSKLALLAFAGYRATHLTVHDTILDPTRDAGPGRAVLMGLAPRGST